MKHPLICKAILNKQRLQFEYNGKMRVVEPQCYGLSTSDNESLRGYQVRGDAQPSNKLFTLSKMSNIEPLNEYFTRPGPEYQRGDRAMKIIYCEL